jgi:cytochrome c
VSRRHWCRGAAAVAFSASLLAAACSSTPTREPPPQVPDSNPGHGADLIAEFGCGSCHVIPGIPEADGKVGPPLTDFGERQYIAGEVANNPANLIRWIMDPKSIESGTAMPDLGVTEEQARDIAAFLYGLR